jgi:hypothetical protein
MDLRGRRQDLGAIIEEMAAGLGMSVVDVLDIENDVAMDAELRTTPRGPPGWKPGPPGSENARCEPPTEKPVVLTRDYYLPSSTSSDDRL